MKQLLGIIGEHPRPIAVPGVDAAQELLYFGAPQAVLLPSTGTKPKVSLSRPLVATTVTAALEAEKAGADAPAPLPYPLQRSATGPMRATGAQENNLGTIKAWAGQSAALAQPLPAQENVEAIWADARAALLS